MIDLLVLICIIYSIVNAIIKYIYIIYYSKKRVCKRCGKMGYIDIKQGICKKCLDIENKEFLEKLKNKYNL